MIARRLGAAIRLSQSAGNLSLPASGLCLSTVASTSYQQHSSSHARTFVSSSSPGAFAPTQTRLAKTKLIEEEVEQQEEEEEDEDEDLFAVDSEEEVKMAHKNSTTQGKGGLHVKVPFEESKRGLSEKLKQIEVGSISPQSLRHSDWTEMVSSATSLDELRSCFEVARQWSALGHRRKSGIPPFDEVQSMAFLKRCKQLGFPEMALYAMMSRKRTCLEYDLRLLRRTQMYLVQKAISSKQQSKLLQSLEVEGAIIPIKGWLSEQEGGAAVPISEDSEKQILEGEESEPAAVATNTISTGNNNIMIRQARLSIIDRTLVLAAVTSVFSKTRTQLDDLTLLLAIRGITGAFASTKEKSKGKLYVDEDFHKLHIRSRYNQAMRLLSKSKALLKDSNPKTKEEQVLMESLCTKILSYSLLYRHLDNQAYIGWKETYDILSKLMKQCPDQMYQQFRDNSESMIQESFVEAS